MKLHLPSSLRSALLSCLAASFVLTTGSGMLQAGEQELTFNGATLNWTTAPENQVFTAADSSPAAFAPGDNVYFTGTTQVTLGEDIAVGILGVETGAHVNITPGAYALEAERIELSGTLDYGSALHIGEGQTLAVEGTGSVLDSALVLQDNGAIEVAAVANLNNNSLSMQGGTALSLSTTGDGRVYNLFTGVSSLLDAQGNTLVLNPSNNAVSNYFDTTRPGTGFWAGATLQLTTDGTLQLVRHSETVKAALTVTTRQTTPEEYSYYTSIAFNDIISSGQHGGAISAGGENSSITLCNNGNVTFRGNTGNAYGGAIFASGENSSVTLNNNGNVTFRGNTGGAYGGAIYASGEYKNSSVTLNNNGNVTFRGNSAGSGGAIYGEYGPTITLCNNGCVTFSENSASTTSGGAIYVLGCNVTLNNNGSVTFSGNTGNSYGGAIYAQRGNRENSSITLCNNGNVTFNGNSSGNSHTGGAIYALGCNVTLNNNGSVTFSENSTGLHGSAICGNMDITLNNNESVIFNNNSVLKGYEGSGGAIRGWSNGKGITLNNNGSVTFSENYGGAIVGDEDGTITLNNNGSVIFNNNSSQRGSAIFGGSSTTLNNNGSVTFSGNTAQIQSSAILTFYDLSIRNNDSVLFEKNAVITDGAYHLRSVYAGNYNRGSKISLSAAKGKSIEFRDSVYIGSYATVGLNADYTDIEGKVIKQEGDIIFTGSYTETHLNELLTAAEAGRTATAEEIANSRTSEMHGKVTLYGGTLRVEEQAVLKTTAGLDVAAGSNASVKVSNAELDADSSNINVGDSGTLTLMNGATVKAANINIADGASFEGRTSSSQEAVATFSLREAASVAEPPQSCLVDANLTLEAGSTLVADGVYFSMTDGSTLTFKALTGGDKINLVLTLGAEYSDNEQVVLFSDADVVRFILDGVELSTTDSLLANTFFTGAWVNDETTLSYDRSNGTISLQHLNTVTIPEPTTATLSLLALAALAARRRRR